jgi:hypothetical protein
MRPLTTKQLTILNNICNSASEFQLYGHESLREVRELRNWNRFDSDMIEKVENKFAEIAKIGEEISNVICIIKDVR